jgi:hypothetical protein
MNRKEIAKAIENNTPLAVFTGYSLTQQPLGQFRDDQMVKVDRLEIVPDGQPVPDGTYGYVRRDYRKRPILAHGVDGALNGVFWTEPRKVLAPWDEYETARREYLEAQERSKQRTIALAEAQGKSMRELQRLLDALGIKRRVATPRGVDKAYVTVSYEDIMQACENAEKVLS